jgi:hypothetical protein
MEALLCFSQMLINLAVENAKPAPLACTRHKRFAILQPLFLHPEEVNTLSTISPSVEQQSSLQKMRLYRSKIETVNAALPLLNNMIFNELEHWLLLYYTPK